MAPFSFGWFQKPIGERQPQPSQKTFIHFPENNFPDVEPRTLPFSWGPELTQDTGEVPKDQPAYVEVRRPKSSISAPVSQTFAAKMPEGAAASHAVSQTFAAMSQPTPSQPSGRGQKCQKGRQVDQQEVSEEHGQQALWTTRWIRNIPNDYNRDDLFGLLNEHKLKFDFAYLPIDWATGANLGYAFVNLVSPAEAVRAHTVLDGFSAWSRASEKVCEVKWGNSDKQGLTKLTEDYRNSPVMHPDVPEEFRPQLFSYGRLVPFPEPTKKPKFPRGLRREARAPAVADGISGELPPGLSSPRVISA